MLFFSRWIRPISRSNILPAQKREYRFVLVQYRTVCCCWLCFTVVYFLLFASNWICYLRRWIISFETINHLNLTIAPFYSCCFFFHLPFTKVSFSFIRSPTQYFNNNFSFAGVTYTQFIRFFVIFAKHSSSVRQNHWAHFQRWCLLRVYVYVYVCVVFVFIFSLHSLSAVHQPNIHLDINADWSFAWFFSLHFFRWDLLICIE